MLALEDHSSVFKLVESKYGEREALIESE